jgi:hypothetical protein
MRASVARDTLHVMVPVRYDEGNNMEREEEMMGDNG